MRKEEKSIPAQQDFLIRNIPKDVLEILAKQAKENHRSKTQEAIVILTNGLKASQGTIQKPKPFKWKTKMSDSFIEKAIDEGRE